MQGDWRLDDFYKSNHARRGPWPHIPKKKNGTGAKADGQKSG